MIGKAMATQAQIDCIQELIQKTKTDLDWFCFDGLTRHQAQDMIDRLRDAYEWEHGVKPRLLQED